MADVFKYKVIRDAACGPIGVSETELNIIDLPIFQRLRRIHQNGFLSMTFPSATHTRFSHSLGVLYYANLMCNQINKDQDILKPVLKPNEIKIIRLAALLHDIGHSPFSHTLENVSKSFLPETRTQTTSEKEYKPKEDYLKVLDIDLVKNIIRIHKDKTQNIKELFGHEIIGSMIVQNHPEINNLLEKEFEGDFETSKVKIQRAICGDIGDGLYMGILHSGLDADKCDYLKRDSLSSGVKYGFYEFEHIIENMEVDSKEREIVFRYKALKSIEYFMFARYFLYNQIFYHKTNLGFNWLAKKSYEALLNANKFVNSKELIESMDNKDFSLFEVYDDYNFLICCRELYKELKSKKKLDEEEEFDLNILRKIIYREPLKPVLACETFTNESSDNPSPTNEKFTLLKDFLSEHKITKMAKKTKIPMKWIITDLDFDVSVTKIPTKFPSRHIYLPPTKIQDKIQEEQEIKIFIDDPQNSKPIGEISSSIIRPLANLHLNGKFLFTKDDTYKNYIIDYISGNEPTLKEFIIE